MLYQVTTSAIIAGKKRWNIQFQSNDREKAVDFVQRLKRKEMNEIELSDFLLKKRFRYLYAGKTNEYKLKIDTL